MRSGGMRVEVVNVSGLKNNPSEALRKARKDGFAAHLSRIGVPVVRLDEAETRQDMDTLEEWLASS